MFVETNIQGATVELDKAIAKDQQTIATISGLTPNTTYKNSEIYFNGKENSDYAGKTVATITLGNISTESKSDSQQPNINAEEVRNTTRIGINSIDFDLEIKEDITGNPITRPIKITRVIATNDKGEIEKGVKFLIILNQLILILK